MDDFTLLVCLQDELIHTLQKRKEAVGEWIRRDFCKDKIRRLRIQIQEVMLRIERACDSCCTVNKEEWYK